MLARFPLESVKTIVFWVTQPVKTAQELYRGSVWLGKEAASALYEGFNLKKWIPIAVVGVLVIAFLPTITGKLVSSGYSGASARKTGKRKLAHAS
jgi:hypothetical protein